MSHNRRAWFESRRLITFICICTVLLLGLLYVYQALLIPVCLGFFLTYLFLPFVDYLHDRFALTRAAAAASVVIGSLGVLVLTGAFILPLVYHEVVAIVSLAPKAVEFVTAEFVPLIKRGLEGFRYIRPEQIDAAIGEFNVASQVGSRIGIAVSGLWSATPSFVAAAVNLFLLPVVLYFLLRDMHAIAVPLGALVPRDLVLPLQKVRAQLDQDIRVLLRGQVVVALILGVLYIVGLSVTGLGYSFAIGAVAGVCRLIPYLDVVVGLTLSAVVIISSFTGWSQFLWVGVVFLVVQSLDGMVITPKIIGTRAGLHPGLVIVSVIAFGSIFGFYGVLLAVPTLAVGKIFGRIIVDAYRVSPWFNADPPKILVSTGDDQNKV